MSETRFHQLGDGRRIAFRHTRGAGPTLVFLPGYMSDMSGSKATALFDWAGTQERDCLLLDYSGCGESSGDFAHGTLSRWRDGQANLVLGGEIAIHCPVRLIHGQRDSDVPFDIALRLARHLRSEDVQVTLVKDGDHRLSRDADIALLLRTVAALVVAS